jgi:hypothetical protein
MLLPSAKFSNELYRGSSLSEANLPVTSFLPSFLTPRSRVLPEKLTGSQLVKKFPAFYGTRIFITVFTNARQLSLSWASSSLSITPHSTSWRFILILSYLCLGFPSYLFPSGFPTKTLYTPLLSPVRAIFRAHLIILDFVSRTILGEEYKSLSLSLCSFHHSLVYLVPLARIFPSAPYSQTSSV